MNKKKEITIIHTPQGDMMNLRDAKIAWDEIDRFISSDKRFQKLTKEILERMQKKSTKTAN